ncbi:transmembrane protein 187-like [Mizuhopecten yessoensis]|uniref:Transmembrane protein 187 n=1 Tax=Mizuhopecten yessoensis TaxID=6573 RepID=A0A210PF30_MIZYE|nr:transmembrane protein 187-like [Mizuhopecten yessoensis]OWF35098.1 Transmembrane protein 187 [Mizuhopecten yessoensis]
MAPVFLRAFMTVTMATAIICFLVFNGGFDRAFTETGLKHYAERASPILKMVLPKWLKMPLNTLVNFGYIIVGAYWLAVVFNHHDREQITETDAYTFYVFNFMACIYGPIQMIRIVTEQHRYAILDQWVTLPFFMWVYIWGRYLSNGWSNLRVYVATALSVSSYTLTLYYKIGFEIALGLHIVLAITGAALSYRKYSTTEAHKPFLCALLSCTGFVVLKLLDLHLSSLHPVFTKVSGHFLSKVGDVLQIHYVNKFFMALTYRKIDAETKKSK